jgi:hypothetical protein
LAMFSILQTQALQTKALDAAAKSTLSPEDLDIFSASLAVANSVQKTRNRLAHWAWGKCTERPDLLVLGDPEGLKERDTRVAAHYQSLKPGAPNLLETYKHSPIRPLQILRIHKDRLGTRGPRSLGGR